MVHIEPVMLHLNTGEDGLMSSCICSFMKDSDDLSLIRIVGFSNSGNGNIDECIGSPLLFPERCWGCAAQFESESVCVVAFAL